MTEDEAKTKWCPLVRVADRRDFGRFEAPVATNRPFGDNLNCMASACAVWETWAPEVHTKSGGRYFTTDETANDLERQGHTIIRGQGDCGLKRSRP